MKQILIFSLLMFVAIPLVNAQDEQETFGGGMATDESEAQSYDTPSDNSVYDNDAKTDGSYVAANAQPVVVIDTLLPVRKSFIRRANIIFKDRDRLRAEGLRLRSEIAELNQDIAKKNKQVREATDYINNQTFAMNDAKKSAQQCKDDIANLETTMEQINDELNRAKRGTIWWTVGGVVVGIGIGVVIGIMLNP